MIEKVDTEPTLFGPCAFSSCGDVIVAHGGEQPFSMFEVDGMQQLNYKPLIFTNWDSEAVIFDIVFLGDCDRFAIVTEDEIKVLKKKKNEGNEDEAEEEDSEPSNNANDLDYDDEDETLHGSGDGADADASNGYHVTPDGLEPMTYYYSATMNVSYRVTSHRPLF